MNTKIQMIFFYIFVGSRFGFVEVGVRKNGLGIENRLKHKSFYILSRRHTLHFIADFCLKSIIVFWLG